MYMKCQTDTACSIHSISVSLESIASMNWKTNMRWSSNKSDVRTDWQEQQKGQWKRIFSTNIHNGISKICVWNKLLIRSFNLEYSKFAKFLIKYQAFHWQHGRIYCKVTWRWNEIFHKHSEIGPSTDFLLTFVDVDDTSELVMCVINTIRTETSANIWFGWSLVKSAIRNFPKGKGNFWSLVKYGGLVASRFYQMSATAGTGKATTRFVKPT